MALYHDSSEVLTGDLPTPVKYFNPEIAREYKKIELAAEQRLLGMLPPELVEDFRPARLRRPGRGPHQPGEGCRHPCAYTKCLEELSVGNREFEPARKRPSRCWTPG